MKFNVSVTNANYNNSSSISSVFTFQIKGQVSPILDSSAIQGTDCYVSSKYSNNGNYEPYRIFDVDPLTQWSTASTILPANINGPQNVNQIVWVHFSTAGSITSYSVSRRLYLDDWNASSWEIFGATSVTSATAGGTTITAQTHTGAQLKRLHLTLVVLVFHTLTSVCILHKLIEPT